MPVVDEEVRWQPVTRPEELEALFQELKAQWRKETAVESNTRRYLQNRSFLRIIGLGPAVLPLILADMQRELNHWYFALEALTGVDPVPPEVRGQIQKVNDIWVAWGRRNGLIG